MTSAVLVGGAFFPAPEASASMTPLPTCARSAILVPSCGVLWGAYVPGGALPPLEGEVGRQFDIFHDYHDMSTSENGAIPSAGDLSLMAGGRILFVTWASREYATGVNYTWPQIAQGVVDNRLDAEANRLKALGPTKVFIAFDAEMEGGLHKVDGTGADYVAAYRHIHDRLASDGVTNVVWAWVPAGWSGNWSQLPGYYPGDAYVDWVGWDPYNFYGCGGRSAWRDVNSTFGDFYRWLDSGGLGAGAAAKPRVLGEYGSHDDPADVTRNGGWYRSIPSYLKTSFPRIKALMQWDSIGVCDSRVDSSVSQPGTLAGFAAAGSDGYLTGKQAPVYIDAGGEGYTDADGQAWLKDMGFTGGATYNTTTPVASDSDTAEAAHSERYGMTSYRLAIPNGTYTVSLLEDEIWFTRAGARIFSVTAQGRPVPQATNVDIYRQVGGNRSMYLTFPVTVSDGTLDLGFTASVNHPKVDGIIITPQ